MHIFASNIQQTGGAEPEINYTKRYLSRHYAELIQQWLTYSKATSSATSSATSTTFPLETAKQIPINTALKKVINNLNQRASGGTSRFEPLPPLLEIPDYYLQDPNSKQIALKLIKTTDYQIKDYYANQEDTSAFHLIGKLENEAIKNAQVLELPIVKLHKGYSPNEPKQAKALKNFDLGIDHNKTAEILRNKQTERLDYGLSTCFLDIDSKHLINSNIDINTKQNCATYGGVWDQPCFSDSDCPFQRCNTNTGYCKMPSGVTNLSYRTPKNIDNALCYCLNGRIGDCCAQKEPKYAFSN